MQHLIRLAALAMGGALTALWADVRVPGLFSDHMVLQRNVPLRVWGNAEPGESVRVSFRGRTVATSADAKGQWELFLQPQSAGGPDQLLIEGKNRIAIEDVLVGEVWVASGQSNMEWRLKHSNNPQEEIAAAKHPQIRLFHVPFRVAESPQKDVDTVWKVCTPETIPDFSAVAYYFARDLQQRLKVPVGVMQAARGGTPAEAWTGREELMASPELQFYTIKWARLFAEYPEATKRYEVEMKKWEAAGKVESTRPRAPMGPGNSHVASGLFNGMIAPLTKYAIQGAIWYQGETNASRSESKLYRTLFPAMIEGWRDRWNLGRFPFLFVQLANYAGAGTGPGAEWPELREAQRYTIDRVPHTGMAVTIDVGDKDNIHPKDKKTVGLRLALAARSIAYGEKVDATGPVYWMAAPEGKAIRVWFHSASSLRPKSGSLRGFAIAGADRVFHSAAGRIERNSVVLESEGVQQPIAVRYAWADNPDANLENESGLPASPFRSDNWDDASMRAEARPVFGKEGWVAKLDPALPNVLILGDSISVGYTREVRHLLQGRANVVRPTEAGKDAPANCRSTQIGVLELDKWLGQEQWKVIHFNFGLHDIAYRNPESKTVGQLDKVNGKLSVSPAEYERNLDGIVGRLKKTGACLIWASATVVPPGEPGRKEGDERAYNEIASRVMKKHGIAVNDLYALSTQFPTSRFLGPGNVHFNAEANWEFGERVAKTVAASLGSCQGVR